MKRVVITRAEPAASQTANRLCARGAEPVLAPLLRIEARAFDTDASRAQALLFTSASGVRAFAHASAARGIPVCAVGEATAEAARACGFSAVRSADGDVNALTDLARRTLDPARGALVHISGADIAGDLVGALRAAGFQAERRIAYEAVAVTQTPAGLLQNSDVILFHSARAAHVFARLGAPNAARMTAACMSQKVADAATDSPNGRIAWARLIVSPAPREDALLHAALAPTDASA